MTNSLWQVRAAGINRITDNRMFDVSHMYPYLVRATGFQYYPHMCMRAVLCYDPVMSNGRFAGVNNCHLHTFSDMSADGLVYCTTSSHYP